MENGNKLILTGSIFYVISFIIPNEIFNTFGIIGLIFIINSIFLIKDISMVLICFSTVVIVILGILTSIIYYDNIFSATIFIIMSVLIFIFHITSLMDKKRSKIVDELI